MGERTSFYNVSGVPHVRIDGKYAAVGASSCSGAAATYRNYINMRLSETGGVAPVAIEGSYVPGSDAVSVMATFTLDDPVTLLSPRAYLMVLEDDVAHIGNVYDHIVRAEYHEAVTLINPGDYQVVTFDFPVDPSWNLENIHCLGFLQKMTGDKEMYNSAEFPMVLDFEFGFHAAVASVPDGNGTAEFTATLTNIGDESDQITVSLEDTFGWPTEFMVEGEAGYHSTPSVVPLDPTESVEVYLRVNTDGAGEIREGGLRAESQVSERIQINTVSVFNGSYAILLVDDDANSHSTFPNEQPYIEGLEANGYLYIHWDVHGEMSGVSPAPDDVIGYDVIIWENGWAGYEPVTPSEAEALQAAMDHGTGVFLSSQDFLNYWTAGDPFLTDYLGIDQFTTNTDAEQAVGVSGDPISDGMDLTLWYIYSGHNRADTITPTADAEIIFYQEIGLPTAVRAEFDTHRSITCVFPCTSIETHPDPNNMATLLDRAIQWLTELQGQSVGELPVARSSSRISAVRSNPLRVAAGQSATFQLRLSDRAAGGDVHFDVLDLNGRLVRSLWNGSVTPGEVSVAWDGRNATGQPVAAGVYYARLTTVDGTDSARLVVVQ